MLIELKSGRMRRTAAARASLSGCLRRFAGNEQQMTEAALDAARVPRLSTSSRVRVRRGTLLWALKPQ